MGRRMVSEIVIPAGFARAYEVKKGQVMRIGQVEGKQVGDVIMFNAHDYKEHFDVAQSLRLNTIQGTGTLKYITRFYSQPSRSNLMFTAVEDTTKVHFVWLGSRCNPKIYELRDNVSVPPHRSCQTNLAEAIGPYGLTPDDVPDVFNVFMNVDIEGDTYVTREPIVGKDDYIDMRAEMDCLVAVSACPSDKAQTNAGRIKPLKVQIYE